MGLAAFVIGRTLAYESSDTHHSYGCKKSLGTYCFCFSGANTVLPFESRNRRTRNPLAIEQSCSWFT